MSTEDYDDDDVATVIAPARKVLGEGFLAQPPLPAAGAPAPSSRRPMHQQMPMAAPQPMALAPQAPMPLSREPGTATRITAVKLGAPLWVKLYLVVTSLLIASGVGALVYLKTKGAW